MFGLAYIVDKVFIQTSSLACEVYVEVSPLRSLFTIVCCQGHAEQGQSDPEWSGITLEWSGITLEWKGFDNKSGGTTLVSAYVLCLDLLSHVWLWISGGQNCCQEIRRGMVYRLIRVKMDIKDINDFNL